MVLADYTFDFAKCQIALLVMENICLPSLAMAETHPYLTDALWLWQEGLVITVRICGHRDAQTPFLYLNRGKQGKLNVLF